MRHIFLMRSTLQYIASRYCFNVDKYISYFRSAQTGECVNFYVLMETLRQKVIYFAVILSYSFTLKVIMQLAFFRVYFSLIHLWTLKYVVFHWSLEFVLLQRPDSFLPVFAVKKTADTPPQSQSISQVIVFTNLFSINIQVFIFDHTLSVLDRSCVALYYDNNNQNGTWL